MLFLMAYILNYILKYCNVKSAIDFILMKKSDRLLYELLEIFAILIAVQQILLVLSIGTWGPFLESTENFSGP